MRGRTEETGRLDEAGDQSLVAYGAATCIASAQSLISAREGLGIPVEANGSGAAELNPRHHIGLLARRW